MNFTNNGDMHTDLVLLGAGGAYLETDWARDQLYSHFGVRARWFGFVDGRQAATELNLRLGKTPKHRFRILGLVGAQEKWVRGFVSPQYADFPDTDVMDSLVGALGSAQVIVLPHSNKTDQCLYLHLTLPTHAAIPTSNGEMRVGVTVRNSEVGYTALSMQPVLWFQSQSSSYLVPLSKGRLHRRIHRGQVKDMRADFTSALGALDAFMGDAQTLLQRLEVLVFGSNDVMAESAYQAIVTAQGAKIFALRVKNEILGGNYARTGLGVVEAIASAANLHKQNADHYFELASIAGAVAMALAF